MTAGRSIAIALVAAGIVAALLLALAGWGLAPPGEAKPFVTFAWVAAGLIAALLGLGWFGALALLIRPLARLAGEMRAVGEVRAGGRIEARGYGAVAPVAEAAALLVDQLAGARNEVADSIAAATAKAEEQKGRLEALLRDLTEGVVVCNLSHQVLLYNQMVVRVLGAPAEFGLGRPLFSFVTREPVVHTLDWLMQPQEAGVRQPERASVPFVCATTDARVLLQGRMSLILGANASPTGYVITFSDATRELAQLHRRDALLRAAIDGFRAPIANLRAAAETIVAHPDIPAEQRRAFEQIIVQESTVASDRLASLAQEHRGLIGGHAAMADLHSPDLISCVIRRLRDIEGIGATMTGLPQWVHGDSYALMLTLAHLIRRIREQSGQASVDIEARPGTRGPSIDVIWAGEPLPSSVLSSWLDAPLDASIGGLTVRSVLERHNSELWSEPDRPGFARLRLPLPGAARPPAEGAREPLPDRPEFYDFDLLHWPAPGADLGGRPLRALEYVVFDTETTGLKPHGEDEVVSIAGVRIVNGRILTGESFSRLINPGRAIPPESTRFHGITDEMVRDKPPLQVVLPQFRAYLGDAVLVAHNIAFDLAFLRKHEAEAGVAFEVPILDTMLLSSTLHEQAGDHTLDGLALRYGIEVRGRHTALGDALATAAILVAMFGALEARGVRTLAEAMRASRVIAELKAHSLRMTGTAGG
jgi:DNA polymerase-3 subunit epsilon